MPRKTVFGALVCTVSLTAWSDDAAVLKEQIQQQQEALRTLQKRVENMQQQQERERIAHALNGSTDSFAQSDFVPDISMILDVSYVVRDRKDEALADLEIPGVAHGIMGEHSHGHADSHAPLNAHAGFNLNYAEVAMRSSVDPYFSLSGIFHLSEEGFEIEEAYGETTALGYGLKAKMGKFRSAFGRINEQHQHVQDFSDMPLVYVAFLGCHGIDDIGVQLQWTLPVGTYLMAGFEALQGKNPSMYGVGAISPAGNKESVAVASPSQPNLLVGYLKSSFDLEATTFLYGVSVAYGDARVDHLEDENPHAFAGPSYLYGVDATLKHHFDSYSYITLQGEYLYKVADGDLYRYSDDTQSALDGTPMTKKQGGYYLQLVYAYSRSVRAGARYDNIDKNDITLDHAAQKTQKNFERYSAMMEYATSEFAKLRLQYNKNKAMFDEDAKRQDIDSVILELNLAIGAHGAHNF